MINSGRMIAGGAIAGCLALSALPLSAQAGSSEREFVHRVLPQLQAAAPDSDLVSNPEDPLQIIDVAVPDDKGMRFNLHNVFNYCQTASAEDCTAQIKIYVQAMSAGPASVSPVNLRVIVRHSTYWDAVLEALKAEESPPPHRKIGDDLYAMLALDSPMTIRVFIDDDAKELGLEADQIWEIAAQQTAFDLPELPTPDALMESLVALEGPEYIGSLLFNLEGWAKLADEVGPDLFVTVTTDNFVLAGILADGEPIDGLRPYVEQDCATAPRCISPNIYRFRDGGWVIAD